MLGTICAFHFIDWKAALFYPAPLLPWNLGMHAKIHKSPADVKGDTKPSVFISYSRKNADFVNRLVQSLEGLGFDCWVDRYDLAPGTKWREEISHSIRQSQAFILVVSSDSMESSIVAQEVSLAEFHGRPIIPLIYEVCELPPGIDLQIHDLHWVNFAVEQYDDAIVKLETALWDSATSLENAQAKTQKSLKAWVPWVGGFYLLSGVYHFIAILCFVGGWRAVFNSEQLNYLEQLSGLEQALWAFIGLLHAAGAAYLLRLCRPVVGLFFADWCIYTMYVALVVIVSSDASKATFVSYGMFSLVVWYVLRLRKANLLSHPQASSVKKACDALTETGISPLEELRTNTELQTVIEKLPEH